MFELGRPSRWELSFTFPLCMSQVKDFLNALANHVRDLMYEWFKECAAQDVSSAKLRFKIVRKQRMLSMITSHPDEATVDLICLKLAEFVEKLYTRTHFIDVHPGAQSLLHVTPDLFVHRDYEDSMDDKWRLAGKQFDGYSTKLVTVDPNLKLQNDSVMDAVCRVRAIAAKARAKVDSSSAPARPSSVPSGPFGPFGPSVPSVPSGPFGPFVLEPYHGHELSSFW